MEITEDQSLKHFNTFHIEARAKYFAPIKTVEEFKTLKSTGIYLREKKLILGGGSNILFTQDFDGLVIKNSLSGIDVIKEDDKHIWLKIGSGENWHELVLTCLKNKWYGLENLSLIPGTAGAAPVQNIGAYGVEIKDFFESLSAIDLSSGDEMTFAAGDCDFGYRKSIFKTRYRNKLFITEVLLRLNKTPKVNISYGALRNYFANKGTNEISPEAVSEAVIAVRKSKLPDPETIGNGGSFFKNPVVPKSFLSTLQNHFPDVPFFPENETEVKLPAAWLIERCNWKGKRLGSAGVHHLQALVLVNLGNASGMEIANLSREIQNSVFEKFQIRLEPEVNII